MFFNRSFHWFIHQHVWVPQDSYNWRDTECPRLDTECLCLRCALPLPYIWSDSR